MPRVLFRQIRSRRAYIDIPAVRNGMANVLDRDVKPLYTAACDAIVRDWEHQPEFKARKQITNRGITIWVYPAGDNKKIWIFVSRGTRPHPIDPVNAAALRFQWGGPGSYRPKTAPARGPARLGGGQELTTRFFQHVDHPGNEPRYFEERIAREVGPKANRIIENAFKRLIRTARKATP